MKPYVKKNMKKRKTLRSQTLQQDVSFPPRTLGGMENEINSNFLPLHDILTQIFSRKYNHLIAVQQNPISVFE